MKSRVGWKFITTLCCACLVMLMGMIPGVAGAVQDLIVHVEDVDGSALSDAQVVFITANGDAVKATPLPDGTYVVYGVDTKVTVEIEHTLYGRTSFEMALSADDVVLSDGAPLQKTVILGRSQRVDAAALAPPTNDLCAEAIPLSVPSVTPGTTTDATDDPEAQAASCGTGVTTPGVWYSIVGTGTTITAETCGASFYDTKITVFCQSCDDLLCIDGNDDSCGLLSSVTWCSELGVEYLILVHGFGGATGDFELTLSEDGLPCTPGIVCSPGPENDLCADAIPVAVPSLTPGTTAGSTIDDDAAAVGVCGTASVTSPGVWYSAIGTGTTMTATTCGPLYDYDTKITVFCGPCDNLVCVDGNDDDCAGGASGLLSTVTWCSQAGAEYLILVHGFGGATGDFELEITEDGQPCTPVVMCLPPGACCLPDLSCADGMPQALCEALGGVYQGDGTACAGSFAGWTIEDCANAFEDISGTGTLGPDGDDQGMVVPIGFTFSFWEDTHTTIGMSTNGYLTFGADLTDYSNDPIPYTYDPNDFIAPLWDDLVVGFGIGRFTHYETRGVEPNRYFIAQWTNVREFGDEDSNTFQAILFEGTNCIEFRYGLISPEEYPDDYTVGVENQDGTDGAGIPGYEVSEGVCKRFCPEYVDPIVCGEVPVDIKPMSCPNPLNTNSRGVLPVAVLGTEDLDASTIDPATILLEGVSPIRWSYEDVATPFDGELCDCHEMGGDGYLDLVLKFDAQSIVEVIEGMNSDRFVASMEPVNGRRSAGTSDVVGGTPDRPDDALVVGPREYVRLTLTGTTYDGASVGGQDCVRVMWKTRGPHNGADPLEPGDAAQEIREVSLSVGYPSGFASGARITFSLPEPTHVSLAVFDVAGRRVKTLMSEAKPDGIHSVHWNGRDEAGVPVANGVYFVRLTAPGVDRASKLVIVE